MSFNDNEIYFIQVKNTNLYSINFQMIKKTRICMRDAEEGKDLKWAEEGKLIPCHDNVAHNNSFTKQ